MRSTLWLGFVIGSVWLIYSVLRWRWRVFRRLEDLKERRYISGLIRRAGMRFKPGMERDDQELRTCALVAHHRHMLSSLSAQSPPTMLTVYRRKEV